jgi:Type II secretion system (T2SS), protein M subtype b
VNVAALWAAARRWYEGHSVRDQRIVLAVVASVALSLVYVGLVDPLIAYRRHVAEEIQDGQEELERAARFLGARDTLRAERDDLRRRYEVAKSHLIPADSGTLGAAALQERANAVASEKGITVQSTQVMREEPADPFRKVAVRLTLSGELRPFAEFVSGLEFGDQQLRIPFVELSRRGAVAGAKGPRTLSATVEVSGYIAPGEKKGKEPAGEAGEGAPAEAAATGEGAPAAEGAPTPDSAPAPEGAPAGEAAPGPPHPPTAEGVPPGVARPTMPGALPAPGNAPAPAPPTAPAAGGTPAPQAAAPPPTGAPAANPPDAAPHPAPLKEQPAAAPAPGEKS